MTVLSSHSTPHPLAQEYPNPSEQAPQQHSLPPPPVGRPTYAPQAAPPLSYVPQQGVQRPVRPIVTINNLSLFSIVLSLILFGAFTFLGGLLVGLSLGGIKESSPIVVPQPYTVISPSGAPHPQSNAGAVYPTHSEMGDLARAAAVGIVPAIVPSNVPRFLEPLKGEVQGLAVQQTATALQQAAQRNAAPAPVTQPIPGSPHSLVAPVVSTPHNYAVRLGTFAAKENAEDLQNKLQALNYRTYLKKEKSSQDTVYHVHSGKYETYATAAHAAQQFTKKSIPGAIVVKLPSDNTSGS